MELLLRKHEYDISVIMMAVYEYFQATVRTLTTDFLFKPFTLPMITLALDNFESPQSRKRKDSFHALPSRSEQVSISIHSQTSTIESIVVFFQGCVTEFCQEHHLPPVDISVCLREALANAIIHGNLEVSSTLKEESWEQFEAQVRDREASSEFADRRVIVRCQMNVEQVRVEIEDQGPGFDPGDVQITNPEEMVAPQDRNLLHTLSESGRGLLLITSLMDQVFWNASGNCIIMVKNLSV